MLIAPNRITRRGAVRRALALALLALALAAAIGACGRGSRDAEDTGSSAEEKVADGEILNEILSRQLGVVAAYPQGMSDLDALTLPILRKFRAQEGEHADGIVKALRGLGEEAAAEPEAIEAGEIETRADRLHFVYTMESATIDAELSAISKLSSPGPRLLLASTVANQAQHLTILRRLLGAKPLATVPEAFESGTTAAP